VREIALFLSIAVMLVLLRGRKAALRETLASLKMQTALYLIFMTWLVFVACFISKDTFWSLNEIKTQWVMGSFAMLLGVGMAVLSREGVINMRALMMTIFWTLAIHVLAINIDGIYRIMDKVLSEDSFQGLTAMTAGVGGLTIGPIDGSLITSLFFVLILSESIFRIVFKKRHLSIPGSLLAVSFILVAGSSFLTGVRNIVEVPVVVVSAMFILFLSGDEARKKAVYAFVIFVPVAVAVFTMAYKSDSRWAEMKESFDLVMRQEEPARILASTHDFSYLTLPNKKPVNVSNFIRLAKYRVGVDILRNYPLGIGFGRNAFGHYLNGRYNKAVGLNGDSSFVDMAVGAGLPGLALFGAYLLSILVLSIGNYRSKRDFYALFLSLTIICFCARMIFDSVLRDHFLEMFMFITGLLATRISLMGLSPALMLHTSERLYDDAAAHDRRMKAV